MIRIVTCQPIVLKEIESRSRRLSTGAFSNQTSSVERNDAMPSAAEATHNRNGQLPPKRGKTNR